MECFENVKKTVLGVFGCLGETNARSKTSSVAWSFKRSKGLKREREREVRTCFLRFLGVGFPWKWTI